MNNAVKHDRIDGGHMQSSSQLGRTSPVGETNIFQSLPVVTVVRFPKLDSKEAGTNLRPSLRYHKIV
jgi:hypothetical protein